MGKTRAIIFWGRFVATVIAMIIDAISYVQLLYTSNPSDIWSKEKFVGFVTFIFIGLLIWWIVELTWSDYQERISKPNIKVSDAGWTWVMLRKIGVANNSWGLPSGMFWYSSTADEPTIAQNPPKVEFTVGLSGNLQVAYIDFINCPKIRNENSFAKGLTANIEFIGLNFYVSGKWDDRDPNITEDRRELLKTMIEPNCQLPRRLYVAMKFVHEKNMYAFSRDYWKYWNWADPNAILIDKKYQIKVILSGDNEMIFPQSMLFELEDLGDYLSFKQLSKN